MKVLHITTNTTGGAGIAAKRLVDSLQTAGIDAELLTQKGKYWSLFIYLLDLLPYWMRIQDKRYKFYFTPGKRGTLCNLQIANYDIIHLHWTGAGFMSLRIFRKILNSGKPVVWTFHDMWPMTAGCHYSLGCMGYAFMCYDCPFYVKSAKYLRKLFRRKEFLSDARFTIVTPSDWLRKCVETSYFFDEHPVRVIPNAIDLKQFKPLNKFGYVLFVASNVDNPIKGVQYFIDAVNMLSEVQIIIVGKNSTRIAEKIKHQTYIHEHIDNMANIYNMCSVLVHTAMEDNLPNTIVEAMACNTPVVAFDVAGVSDMIEHKKTGYLAQYKNTKDLAAGIQWVLDNDLGEAPRIAAERKYNFTETTGKYIELYDKLYRDTHIG